MIIQNNYKEKVFYYVAILSRKGDIIKVEGTYNTTKEDFPIQEVKKHVLKKFKRLTRVICTFYKEITEDIYKAYNNEQ